MGPLEIASILSVTFGAFSIFESFRQTRRLAAAENRMVELMKLNLQRKELEAMRDDLLRLKAHAVRIGFEPMERFYEIEHRLNLVTVKLDAKERVLVERGLQQPNDGSRLSYMLKLFERSVAVS